MQEGDRHFAAHRVLLLANLAWNEVAAVIQRFLLLGVVANLYAWADFDLNRL